MIFEPHCVQPEFSLICKQEQQDDKGTNNKQTNVKTTTAVQ
jgi:hypothetical protein